LDRLNASREESRFVESLNRCTVQSSGLQLAAHHPVQRFSGSTV